MAQVQAAARGGLSGPVFVSSFIHLRVIQGSERGDALVSQTVFCAAEEMAPRVKHKWSAPELLELILSATDTGPEWWVAQGPGL